MTDKQALRQLATDAHELGIIKRYSKGLEAQRKFYAAATPLVIRALLDELEADKEQIKTLESRNRRLNGIIEAAERRIAEQRLESRLLANADRDIAALRQCITELGARAVKLPEALVPAIHNSGEPFMRPEPFGLYLNRDDVLKALGAAGIGIKGESNNG